MRCIQKIITYDSKDDFFYLLPISDIHLGNVLCDEVAAKEHLKKYHLPNSFYYLCGDINDSVIVKDKRYDKAMDASGARNAILNYQADKTEELLTPYKDQILAYGIGNHEFEIIAAASYDMGKEMSRRLNVPYCGYSYMLTLYFRRLRTNTIKIYVNHGWGGGSKTAGGSLTKYTNHAQSVIADVCCYGHDHKLQSSFITLIGSAGSRQIAPKKHVVLCGAYQKTYSSDETSPWAERKGFPAITVGSPVIKIWPETGRNHTPKIEVKT